MTPLVFWDAENEKEIFRADGPIPRCDDVVKLGERTYEVAGVTYVYVTDRLMGLPSGTCRIHETIVEVVAYDVIRRDD